MMKVEDATEDDRHPRMPIDPKSIRRILVIRVGRIGDALATTPAVHALRRSFPDAHLIYLTSRAAKVVLLHNPDIDEICVYYDKRMCTKIMTSTRGGGMKNSEPLKAD